MNFTTLICTIAIEHFLCTIAGQQTILGVSPIWPIMTIYTIYRIVSREKPSYRIDIVSNRKKAYRYWLVCSNYYILSCKCLLPQRMFLLPNNLQMYSNEICLRCWIFASACICQLTLKTKLIHVPIARKLISF